MDIYFKHLFYYCYLLIYVGFLGGGFCIESSFIDTQEDIDPFIICLKQCTKPNMFPLLILCCPEKNRMTFCAFSSLLIFIKTETLKLDSFIVHRTWNQFWNRCLVLMLSLFVHKRNLRKIYNILLPPCGADKSQLLGGGGKMKDLSLSQLPSFFPKNTKNFLKYKR